MGFPPEAVARREFPRCWKGASPEGATYIGIGLSR